MPPDESRPASPGWPGQPWHDEPTQHEPTQHPQQAQWSGDPNAASPDAYRPPPDRWAGTADGAQPTGQYATPGGWQPQAPQGAQPPQPTQPGWGGAPTGYATTEQPQAGGYQPGPSYSGYSAGWGGQPGQPGQPAAAKKGRKPLILGLVTVLVIALLAGGYFLFLGKKNPKLTFAGKSISNADQVLTDGQKQVLSQVSTRHGAKNADTRCYFAVPSKAASGAKKTDVANQLYCGPVLFVDGTAGQDYLTYTINQTSSKDGKVVLGLAATPQSPNPAAPSKSLKLQRPDGASATSGSGDLKAPAPPAADKDALVVSSVDESKLSDAPGSAEMIGGTFGVKLAKVGTVERYGGGDSARVAAQGTQLIAFTFTLVDGADGASGSSPQIGVQVGSAEPRAVPGRTPAVIVAVPTGQSATLIMVDGGVKQELSLPGGKPGSDNVLINVRKNTQITPKKSGSIRLNLRASGDSGYFDAKYTLSKAGIFATVSGRKPSSPRNCFYLMNLTYKRVGSIHGPFTGSGSGPFVFRTSLVKLVVNGKSYSAHTAGSYTYYEIPASVTNATVVISGRVSEGNGTTQSVNKTVKIAVKFPAG